MKKNPLLIIFICLVITGIAILAGFFFVNSGSLLSNLSFKGGNKIAVIEIDGVIVQSREIIKNLIHYRDNARIKALVLRIDSPGGSVGPSQEIYEELIKIRDKKPIVVSMGSVAASGGYYIASAAHRIFANPGTITGSIGVIIEFANIEELLGKIGMKSVVIKSGKYKDILSPSRQLQEDEKSLVQDVINSIHNQFVDAVALGRNLPKEKVAEIADGRIFSGEQAKTLGLVDELGNLEDAVKAAAERAGIIGEPDIVYPEKKRPTLWDYVIQESVSRLQEIMSRNRLCAQFIVPVTH